MTAFDTDILSELFSRVPAYTARAAAVPAADRCAPVAVLEEVLRGRLDGIRQAQAGRIRLTLPRAYELFRDPLEDTRQYRVLVYTDAADALFRQWRAAKIRVGTQDLRIAATAVAHNAKLVTRNARDYAQVPGLNLEVWN